MVPKQSLEASHLF